MASPPSSRAETGGARLPETPRVSGAVSSRPGPEFESVVFPRYPGFVTLASGVQVRDLCVPEDEDGDGSDAKKRDDAFVKPGDEVVVEYGLWTVHQGRNVVPPPVVGSAHAHETFAFTVTGGDSTGEGVRAKQKYLQEARRDGRRSPRWTRLCAPGCAWGAADACL